MPGGREVIPYLGVSRKAGILIGSDGTRLLPALLWPHLSYHNYKNTLEDFELILSMLHVLDIYKPGKVIVVCKEKEVYLRSNYG